MTWPFENDTSAITKKLAKKSLQSEKRRNLMVVIAVALAAFLICFTGIVSTSLTQMQRNQVVDTYEAVWLGVEENDIETLKGLPEFERVGGYYMLGEELSEQGYHASYVYCDAQMMEITKAQMELLEGRVPEKANEVVVSEYFLSTYGNNAKIGDTVTLDTESFHGDYSQSEYVVSNRDGDPLSYTQFKRLWQYIVTRTVKERFYYRYEDGKRVKHTVTPVLGEKAAHNGKVIYSLDFEVTPHQLRHTYITNLIHSSVDPKTVQYLAGHESSKITMDIYAKVKYNRPDELVRTMGGAFAQWDAAQA